MTIWRKLLLFNKYMKIWIRTMPSYSYETTMTTTSSASSSSSRAKSESRCSSVSSKVGFWQLEEMQEEQFQIQRQIWYLTASKTQLTFFLQKLDEEFYSGLNLSDGERLRLARSFSDCINFEFFWNFCNGFDISVWESRDFWILRFVAFFHCRCAVKSLKILSNREFYYPPHIALSGNYYPRFQIIKIFKFIVTSFSFEESKLWMVSGTKHKATLRQALPMWPT